MTEGPGYPIHFDGPNYDAEEFHRGYTAGLADKADPELNLSSEEQIKVWDDASPSWKHGWAEAFDADSPRKETP